MKFSSTFYLEQLNNELKYIPEEYYPLLLDLVHTYRRSVSINTTELSIEQGYNESLSGKTKPIIYLWENLDLED